MKPSLTVYYVEADDDTVTEGFHHAHEVGDVNDPRIIVKNAQERGFSIILASEVTDIRDGYPNITYNYMEKIERLVMDEEYPFGPDASNALHHVDDASGFMHLVVNADALQRVSLLSRQTITVISGW